MVVAQTAHPRLRPLLNRGRGLLRHGLALLTRALTQSSQVRAPFLPRISLRHLLVFLPVGLRGTFEASFRQRTFRLHFRLFYHLVLDDLLRAGTPLHDADHRFQRVSSAGADVVHYQLLARRTKRLVALFQIVLSDCVIDGVEHVERLGTLERAFFSLFQVSLFDVMF